MKERVALVVLGMHRSGTSAMARLLSLAGATLPAYVMGANIGNETGHWEPQRVADYNDAVLASLDAAWDSPFGLGMNATRRAGLDRFVDGARAIVREEYGDASLIVLKEPRVSLLADLWTRALEAEGYRCKFVVMMRAPTEVAASLRKRNGLALDKGLLLWGAYQASAELLTRRHDRVFCRYDDVLMHPASVLDRVETALRLELPHRTTTTQAEMDGFIRPDLKHNDASGLVPIPDHLGMVRDLSAYIDAAAAGDVPNIDTSRELQEWFADLDRIMTPLMLGIVQGLAQERDAAVAGVREELAAAHAHIGTLVELAEYRLGEIGAREAAIGQGAQMLHEAEARIEWLETAERETGASLERQKDEIGTLLATIAALRGEIEIQAAEVAALIEGKVRLEAAQVEAVTAAERLATEHAQQLSAVDAGWRDQHGALAARVGAAEDAARASEALAADHGAAADAQRAEVERLSAENTDLHAQLAAAMQTIAAREGELSEARALADASRDEVDGKAADIAALADRLGSAEAEAAGLRDALAASEGLAGERLAIVDALEADRQEAAVLADRLGAAEADAAGLRDALAASDELAGERLAIVHALQADRQEAAVLADRLGAAEADAAGLRDALAASDELARERLAIVHALQAEIERRVAHDAEHAARLSAIEAELAGEAARAAGLDAELQKSRDYAEGYRINLVKQSEAIKFYADRERAMKSSFYKRMEMALLNR